MLAAFRESLPRVSIGVVRRAVGRRSAVSLPEPDISHAVLVPFTHEEEATLLFTRRSAGLQRFPDEISFPGGRRERTDPTLEETALREANEEVAIRRDHVEIVGRLDDRVAYGGHRIRPIVGVLHADARPLANPIEVDQVFTIPVHRFLEGAVYEARSLKAPKASVEPVVHYFHLPEALVWGVTGRMVSELLEICAGWRPPRKPVLISDPADFAKDLSRP